jgi:hypothetical protein
MPNRFMHSLDDIFFGIDLGTMFFELLPELSEFSNSLLASAAKKLLLEEFTFVWVLLAGCVDRGCTL